MAPGKAETRCEENAEGFGAFNAFTTAVAPVIGRDRFRKKGKP